MTFRIVTRGSPVGERVYATPFDSVRLASHKIGQETVMLIWIGRDLAAKLGLIDYRHAVDLLVDDESEQLRLAIQVNAEGSFRAARRGVSFCVYLNSKTTARFFRQGYSNHTFGAESIDVSPSMVSFTVPEKCRCS